MLKKIKFKEKNRNKLGLCSVHKNFGGNVKERKEREEEK